MVTLQPVSESTPSYDRKATGRDVLVIPGSFLGRQTPAIRQYHSHPGDDFWPVMEAIIGIDSCRREGSGDPATESFFPVSRKSGPSPSMEDLIRLPSTSPADARYTRGEKIMAWRVICDHPPGRQMQA
ncbi:MAG: hypothetical protein ACXQTN_06270 [Methanoculleaceae archaeon]